MPAPNPNISAVRPNSLFIVSAANPTLTRSNQAMTKHRIRNGMRRHAALRDAPRAAMSIALPSLNCKRRADSLRLTHAQATDVVKLSYNFGKRLPAVGLALPLNSPDFGTSRWQLTIELYTSSQSSERARDARSCDGFRT